VSSRSLDLSGLVWPRHTQRLVLRPGTDGDVDAVLAYRSRPGVAEYLSRGPLDRAEVAARIEQDIERAQPGHPDPLLGLVVEEAGQIEEAGQSGQSGPVIGDCMLRFQHDDNGMWAAALAYTIHPDRQGQGFATEVARELIRLSFTELHLALVEAEVFVPNRASQRVAETAGMRVVATKAAGSEGGGRPRMDDLVYAVTAAEWASHGTNA
jgi:RimJ/RimL family protein N-acetyltransferase